jgi:hypothetical protein
MPSLGMAWMPTVGAVRRDQLAPKLAARQAEQSLGGRTRQRQSSAFGCSLIHSTHIGIKRPKGAGARF